MGKDKKNKKRKVDVIVLSDVHLGTYGCHAKELLRYLKSVKPKKLILNGDIIDGWQFRKRYWPKAHMQVIRQILTMMNKGTKVIYIPGNHDEVMRKFVGYKLGKFKIVNKAVIKIDGRKAWIFHGDVFDVTMQHSKWIAQLGAIGYDMLILLNRFVNFIFEKMGKGKISLSRRIKNSVKSAVKFINNFEQTAADIAIDNGYDFVICGHIHQPEMRKISNMYGEVMYLNSGDWIENLTTLEYNDKQWSIYRFHSDHVAQKLSVEVSNYAGKTKNELFQTLVEQFEIKTKTA